LTQGRRHATLRPFRRPPLSRPLTSPSVKIVSASRAVILLLALRFRLIYATVFINTTFAFRGDGLISQAVHGFFATIARSDSSPNTRGHFQDRRQQASLFSSWILPSANQTTLESVWEVGVSHRHFDMSEGSHLLLMLAS